ncbi:hypothetical protein LOCC1_G004953 [Lachnellula occidentalis]|uniref:Ipa protein n=1 Tax=Lachnellula occidentalis TaxID=215460 RepID=A0A8H8UCL7_9HELO|nr:hypothetical protein LOCC1_G004953 [Lachnellula occidentalis]
MDVPMENGEALKELQRDLARKYRIHGAKIEQIWRSLDKGQRTQAVKAGAADGMVLKDPSDRSMGNVFKFMPEMNLRDITEPGSDYLLNILKHRATKLLSEQYIKGPDNAPGDQAVIVHNMRVNNLRHLDDFKYSFTLFMDEDQYGQSFDAKNNAEYEKAMADLSVVVNAGLCVPQSTGELILLRQLYTLQMLSILVDDILEIGSTSRNTKQLSKKPEEAARAALSKLSIIPKPERLSLQELMASALDQKSSLDGYLSLCREEPVFLAHTINIWFFTRPELIKDEKGRILPFVTDNYISIAFFEMIHNAIIGAAIWDYLCRLLQLLIDGLNDNKYRAIILQEISNVCHLEYGRVQKLFKRQVQTSSGSKYFKRVSGVYDNGIARVSMKGKPESLTRENPRLHYMLRLCEPGVDASKAITWIKQLDDLHRSHPREREAMDESEFESFGDLAVIVGFVQSLSSSLALPPMNLKKGQIYISRSKELATELDPLKSQLDLADFAIPIDNLTEPGMAAGALNALDQFIVEKTGTEMGFLYQDLIEKCVIDIQQYYQRQKTAAAQNAQPELLPALAETTEVRVEQRRQKHKTRPPHSSAYDISPNTTTAEPEKVERLPVFKVKQDTVNTFSTLFSKSQSRGSITWMAFETAMADLKFSVMPKFGSVFMFCPPSNLAIQKSLTLHRPHKSQIEGHLLLIFASRLKRVYGWGEQSFEVA